MTAFAVALPLLLTLSAGAPERALPPGDGGDPIRHVLVSFVAVTHGTAALRWAGVDRGSASALALGAGALLGVGKELHDRARGGRFDIADLAWDAVGLALGALLIGAVR